MQAKLNTCKKKHRCSSRHKTQTHTQTHKHREGVHYRQRWNITETQTQRGGTQHKTNRTEAGPQKPHHKQ